MGLGGAACANLPVPRVFAGDEMLHSAVRLGLSLFGAVSGVQVSGGAGSGGKVSGKNSSGGGGSGNNSNSSENNSSSGNSSAGIIAPSAIRVCSVADYFRLSAMQMPSGGAGNSGSSADSKPASSLVNLTGTVKPLILLSEINHLTGTVKPLILLSSQTLRSYKHRNDRFRLVFTS
jgi:hypothetical protein